MSTRDLATNVKLVQYYFLTSRFLLSYDGNQPLPLRHLYKKIAIFFIKQHVLLLNLHKKITIDQFQARYHQVN
ncbi:hypothetical protein KY46_20155 [Photobacterium halotolerans]|uniref:Uncharacterized protein n=1 Tax=Photobacterium halotolerans TaxID=265726 RepID=A0A0F5V7J6_9GAMM|nr:hypothetical protein KY46_20155 [Photobacterium halotolerans]